MRGLLSTHWRSRAICVERKTAPPFARLASGGIGAHQGRVARLAGAIHLSGGSEVGKR